MITKIKFTEDFRIPGTNVLIEAGDIIQVQEAGESESLKDELRDGWAKLYKRVASRNVSIRGKYGNIKSIDELAGLSVRVLKNLNVVITSVSHYDGLDYFNKYSANRQIHFEVVPSKKHLLVLGLEQNDLSKYSILEMADFIERLFKEVDTKKTDAYEAKYKNIGKPLYTKVK